MKKLLIVANVDWDFLLHRYPIAKEALKRGYEVTVAAIEEEGRGNEIRELGFNFIAIPGERGSTNIFSELKIIFFLIRLYRRIDPDVIHHFSMKNNLYGSIAGRMVGNKKLINTLTGLGSLFYDHHKGFSYLKKILRVLFLYGFKNKRAYHIFQNTEDMQYFNKFVGIDQNHSFLVEGSGVDLDQFFFSEELSGGKIKFVLAARLLWDKGIGEYEKAAAILKRKYGDKVQFLLAGKLDAQNITGISKEEMAIMQERGNIEWVGNVDDMPRFYGDSHVVVLPSYREGLSKTLIEACAIGRPIITADVAGCREIINNGKNGFLVPARDYKMLAEKMEVLYLDTSLRHKMGKESRKHAENTFAEEIIVKKVFNIYDIK